MSRDVTADMSRQQTRIGVISAAGPISDNGVDRAAAELGRLDVLSFTAGVGENSPALRAAVVDGLDGLGFLLDPDLNAERSKVARVI